MPKLRAGRSRAPGARDAAVSEVVGGTLLLTITLAMFVILSSAMLQQARDTAAYIRSLVPQDPAAGEAELCVPFPQGTWCRGLPREAEPGERCVVDTLGWQWCLGPPGLPGRPELGRE